MRSPLIRLALPTLAALLLLAAGTPATAAELPEEGDTLPELVFLAPDLQEDADYLGLAAAETFTLADAAYDVLLLEIVGVYCPFCHEQTPLFNDLAKRIERAGLDQQIKMAAVASGATEAEIAYLRDYSGYAYPLLRDQDYSLHKQLGEPQTPFTMIVDRQGTVLYVHMGVIEDIDDLFNRIKELAQ